jgi:hypothetical protein
MVPGQRTAQLVAEIDLGVVEATGHITRKLRRKVKGVGKE